MPGTPVRLGPFIGGMNTYSDPSFIADNELVDCVNFELDIDGSLVSRAPVQDITAGSNVSVMGGKVICLGYAIFVGNRYYLIGVGPAGVGAYNGTTWSLFASGVKCTSITQYAEQLFVLATPTSAQPGGWWHPDTGWHVVSTQPRGSSICNYKETLWIAAGSEASAATASRIRFSAIDANGTPQPTTWNTDDYFDVSSGDGQWAMHITVFQDTIVVFKNDSTYAFPFDIDPTAGTVKKISETIGVTNVFCAVHYENVMFVFHEGWVYQLVNFVYTRVNNKVPFQYVALSQPSTGQEVYLYTLGDRLVVRYYARVYVLGLRTLTWTRYVSSLMVGISIASPTASPQRKNIVYYAGSAADAKANFYKITDGTEDTVTEEMTCSIKTKHYDFGYSPRYKRLNWWGLDCNTTDPVNTKIYVLIADYRLTWANARQYRWADLETWWQPIQYPWTTDTAVANRSTYSKPFRQFIKFLKSVRYRLIRFEITMTTNGATNRGPIRIYSITAFTNPKEIMEKKVS